MKKKFLSVIITAAMLVSSAAPSTAMAAIPLSNSATITSENGADTDITSASADTNIVAPDLAITKTLLTDDVRCGDDVTYLIKITNNGDGEARSAVVEDEIDTSKVTLVSATSNAVEGITYTTSTTTLQYEEIITWTITEIPVGETVELYLVVNVNDNLATGTKIKNSAAITWENGDDIPDIETDPTETGVGDDSGTPVIIVGAPDITMVKEVDKAQARVGDTLTYTIEVTNNGTASARSVDVQDILSGLVSLNSSSLSSDDNVAYTVTTDSGSEVIDWIINSIAAGDSVTLTFKVTIVG